MKKFLLVVTTQLEIEAPSLSDAREVVDEYFGEGTFGDLEVLNYEILDEEELQ